MQYRSTLKKINVNNRIYECIGAKKNNDDIWPSGTIAVIVEASTRSHQHLFN